MMGRLVSSVLNFIVYIMCFQWVFCKQTSKQRFLTVLEALKLIKGHPDSSSAEVLLPCLPTSPCNATYWRSEAVRLSLTREIILSWRICFYDLITTPKYHPLMCWNFNIRIWKRTFRTGQPIQWLGERGSQVLLSIQDSVYQQRAPPQCTGLWVLFLTPQRKKEMKVTN